MHDRHVADLTGNQSIPSRIQCPRFQNLNETRYKINLYSHKLDFQFQSELDTFWFTNFSKFVCYYIRLKSYHVTNFMKKHL